MSYPPQFWNMLHEANNERLEFGLPELTPEQYYPQWKQMILIETGSDDDLDVLD